MVRYVKFCFPNRILLVYCVTPCYCHIFLMFFFIFLDISYAEIILKYRLPFLETGLRDYEST